MERPRGSKPPQDAAFTTDELAILGLMADGLTWAVIARRLGCSERTVRRRVAQMTTQHGFTTPIELVVAAVRRGLL